MTPDQLRIAIDRLSLSQRGAARLLGVNERTVRKWIAGDAEIPQSAAMVLNISNKFALTPEDFMWTDD
jgi:DNA-binding transcriptional regulator YiaG